MIGRSEHRMVMHDCKESSKRQARPWKSGPSKSGPWKSGASAPRKDSPKDSGFSPRRQRGLKANISSWIHNAALKGPLFHDRAGILLTSAVLLILAGLFATTSAAQVTSERLLT